MTRWASSSEKMPSKMGRMCRFRSSCASAKYHPGLCPPFTHSSVSNDSVIADIESMHDQTARMLRLIWAFAVRICPKTLFRMARPLMTGWWNKAIKHLTREMPFPNVEPTASVCRAAQPNSCVRIARRWLKIANVRCTQCVKKKKKKKKKNECTRKSGPSVEFYGRSYSIVRQKISLPIRGESKTVLLDNTDSWFHLKIDMSTALHSYDKFVVYRSDHLALVATIALNNQSTESSDGSIVSKCRLGKWSWIVIQSTLVISISLISNNRLSRSENLVLVLTQRSTNRQHNIVEKKRNCSLEQFLLISTIFSIYL